MTETKDLGQQLGAPLMIYQARYEKLDPSEVTLRTGVPFDAEQRAFTLTVLGHTVSASWPEFMLTPADFDACPRALYTGEALILVIRYLIEGVRADSGGGWLPYRELPWGEVYDRNFQGRCVKRLAYGFGQKLDVFASACEKLGGVLHPKGDVSYDLEFVPGVTVRLLLWAGDDEFPPQSQWLFSDNTPLAFSAEDVAVIGDTVIGALKEVAKKG
jgi:hypothetical protein